jgi:signal transduction histidine kinase
MLFTDSERRDHFDMTSSRGVRQPDLLAVVAHDLRQPVSAALMAAEFAVELLESVPRTDMARKQLAIVQRCVREALRISEDLLTMRQVEAGALRLRLEPVRLSALLEDARTLIAPQADLKRIEVSVSAPEVLPHPLADRNRLLQVLTNLCANAVKFTPAGGTIRIVATCYGGSVRIAVTDSGTGIAVADMQRVFDEFWQGTTDARSVGAGLGLTIARWLVEAHGGLIAAERASGGGTTVAFTIPLVASGTLGAAA